MKTISKTWAGKGSDVRQKRQRVRTLFLGEYGHVILRRRQRQFEKSRCPIPIERHIEGHIEGRTDVFRMFRFQLIHESSTQYGQMF